MRAALEAFAVALAAPGGMTLLVACLCFWAEALLVLLASIKRDWLWVVGGALCMAFSLAVIVYIIVMQGIYL